MKTEEPLWTEGFKTFLLKLKEGKGREEAVKPKIVQSHNSQIGWTLH